MFRFINGNLPDVFQSMFVFNRNMHDRITRQTNKLHVPAGKTEAIKKSIRFMGVKIWNEFSNKIDYNCCIYTYKQRVKSYLLSNEPL